MTIFVNITALLNFLDFNPLFLMEKFIGTVFAIKIDKQIVKEI